MAPARYPVCLAITVLLTDGAVQSAAAPMLLEAVAVLVKVARAAGAAAARTTTAGTATARRLSARSRSGGLRVRPFGPEDQIASSMAASRRAGTTWTVAWWTGADRRARIAVPA